MANQASPPRLAAAIAARLNQVVPIGFSVRSSGDSVDVYRGADDRHASAAAVIIRDEDGRSLAERLTTAASAILNAAQDAVSEILTEEWPLGPNGRVVEAGVRVEGDRLLMWFGEESAPAIVLAPMRIAEIMEGAA